MEQSDKDNNTSHHTNAQTITDLITTTIQSQCRNYNTQLNLSNKEHQESTITKLHLTHLSPNMTKNFLTLINSIISTGRIPPTWKHAIMIFLRKLFKLPLTHVNYRLVPLLHVPGKILEKKINTRLTHILEDNKLNNEHKHGFRPNRGTHTGLLYETIKTFRANNNRVDIVLRDLSRAFDKAWHNGLFFKLLDTNLPDCLTRLLCDYLRDRTAKIRIYDYYDPTFTLHSGVPQGECLSPTLFSYYTHDIPDTLDNSQFICYAVDITQIIPYAGKSKKHARLHNNKSHNTQ